MVPDEPVDQFALVEVDAGSESGMMLHQIGGRAEVDEGLQQGYKDVAEGHTGGSCHPITDVGLAVVQHAELFEALGCLLKTTGCFKTASLVHPQVNEDGSPFHRFDQMQADDVGVANGEVVQGSDHHVGRSEGILQYVGMEGGGEQVCT